jgi:hypothetical protein
VGMRSSTFESGRRPDALVIRMATLGPLVRTQAIFIDFAASASPGLQDALKRLAGQGTGQLEYANSESPEGP